MKVQLPKNANKALKKRTQKLIDKMEKGTIQFRKTERHGYKTVTIGRCERAVVIDNVIYIFSQHSDYEKFINRAA